MEVTQSDNPVILDGDSLIRELSEESVAAPDATLPEAFDPVVKLPTGLREHSEFGTVTSVEVRELTGLDEERIERAARGAGWQFANAVLLCGIDNVNGQPATQSLLDALPATDLDAIALGVRVATYGSDINYDVRCRACEHQQNVTFTLPDDVPVHPQPAEPLTVRLRSGALAHLRYPNGLARRRATDASGSGDSPEADTVTALLSECVTHVTDSDELWFGAESVRSLGVKDRRELTKALTTGTPGTDLSRVPVECENCKSEVLTFITYPDLFR